MGKSLKRHNTEIVLGVSIPQRVNAWMDSFHYRKTYREFDGYIMPPQEFNLLIRLGDMIQLLRISMGKCQCDMLDICGIERACTFSKIENPCLEWNHKGIPQSMSVLCDIIKYYAEYSKTNNNWMSIERLNRMCNAEYKITGYESNLIRILRREDVIDCLVSLGNVYKYMVSNCNVIESAYFGKMLVEYILNLFNGGFNMNNYRKEAQEMKEAESKLAAAAEQKPAKKYNNANTKPKRQRYKTQIKSIAFDYHSNSRNEFDASSALNLLSIASFDVLSIPVTMNASLCGKDFSKPINVGYINGYETTLEGEIFNVTINEEYIDAVKKIEEASGLFMKIRLLVDRDNVATKMLSFELKPITTPTPTGTEA